MRVIAAHSAVLKHRRFLVLLSMFILISSIQQLTLPAFEGGDEGLHQNYVTWLRVNGTLPDRSTSLTNSVQQASGQPPLFYTAGAALLNLLQVPATDGDMLWSQLQAIRNPWYAPPDQWNPVDNRNVYLHAEGDQQLNLPNAEQANRILRLVGLGFGILAVIGAYGAAREVFVHTSAVPDGQTWALVATALYAFTPQVVHISSIFHNDVAPTAMSVLVIWQTLRMLRLGLTVQRLAVIGLLLGLAGLAKINALLVAPEVGLVLLFSWQQHRSVGTFMKEALSVALCSGLLLVPWLLYGLLNYGDLLGTNTHLRPGYYYETPLTLYQLMPLLPEVYLGYWGKLASATYLHPVTYTLLGTLVVLAGAGYLAAGRPQRLSQRRKQQIIIFAVITLSTFLGLMHWLRTIHFITGRLLFPAHIVTACVLTGGLAFLAQRLRASKAIQAYAFTVILASSVVFAPLSLLAAYRHSVLIDRDQIGPLQGQQFDYDGIIRFLGYQSDSDQISGSEHAIRLCWEVLAPTDRWAAFSVKIVHDAVQIADRTSLHGLGLYPSALWKPGDRFCDEVQIPITTAPEPGQTYVVLLLLLDARTGDVNWHAAAADGTPVQYPIIAQLRAP